MKAFFKWLKTRFSRPTYPIASDRVSNTVSVEPGDVPTTFGADEPGRPDTVESGKGILMPDVYADSHAATEPDLKILIQSSPGVDESAGFNPYDTGVLQKK